MNIARVKVEKYVLYLHIWRERNHFGAIESEDNRKRSYSVRGLEIADAYIRAKKAREGDRRGDPGFLETAATSLALAIGHNPRADLMRRLV